MPRLRLAPWSAQSRFDANADAHPLDVTGHGNNPASDPTIVLPRERPDVDAVQVRVDVCVCVCVGVSLSARYDDLFFVLDSVQSVA